MVPVRVKAEWSFVRVVPGVQCVMMPGVLMMPLSYVDSWDSLISVSSPICQLQVSSLSVFICSTDATAFSFARFGQGSGPIYLDQVGCTGSEAMLGDCTSNPIGVHDCSHFEDAGVGCQGTVSTC